MNDVKTLFARIGRLGFGGSYLDRYYQGVVGCGEGYPTIDEARRDGTDVLSYLAAHDAEQVNRALLSALRSPADVPRQLEAYVVDLTAFLSGPGHRRYVQVLAELPPTARDARLIWQRGPERSTQMWPTSPAERTRPRSPSERPTVMALRADAQGQCAAQQQAGRSNG